MNMMDFKELTDFEVNLLVAKKLGWKVRSDLLEGHIGFTEDFHRNYPNTIWAIHCDLDGWEQFCFTAEGGDAWLVIDKLLNTGITLTMNNSGISTGSLEIECAPLRAAMILFLETYQERNTVTRRTGAFHE